MDDTSPEIKMWLFEKYMTLSGEERMLMGARSFNAAKTMILASFPPGLPEHEVKLRLFERIYGKKLEEFIGRNPDQ